MTPGKLSGKNLFSQRCGLEPRVMVAPLSLTGEPVCANWIVAHVHRALRQI